MSPEKINDKRRGRIYAYAPFIVWTVVILLLGSGAGSMTQTSRIIGPLLEFLFPSAAPETRLFLHALIRKSAHFVEYAMLGFLAVRAFTSSLGRSNWRAYLLALIAVAAVASVDEFNQSFQVSRTSSPWDIVLDVIGGLFAVTITYLIFRRRQANEPNLPASSR